ncbi:MAG: ABC-F type ribosomal protection protein [Firmicutes bacterium]|nr:ABC-F type ribosomal protection protein [Bacillota bacterium]
MIVLSCTGLGKSYGTDVILENVSFHVNAGDRVGIVGVNGAGKTTLMNMLTGELEQDTGSFFIAKDTSLGYLKQRDYFDPNKTVLQEVSGIFSGLDEMEREISSLNDEIAAAKDEKEQNRLWNRLTALQSHFERQGGYTYKSEITGVMTSMGFGEESYNMLTGSLSGGERTRLALACLLLRKPDILMLDEPTNHLDIGTLKWLEQYLKAYSGTIILISHDRYFLDTLVTHVFDVENHGLKVYQGNYTQYAEKKKQDRDIALKAYTKQQEEIRRQEDLIRSYKERGTEKLAKRAQSREKRLAHVERLEKPGPQQSSIKVNFSPRFQSGTDTLLGENLSFGYPGGGRDLFKDVNFDIKRGEKICIVGDNGTGKTTLLKVMMEELSPKTGYVKRGHNVELGYYDQGQLLLDDSLTVMDEIHNRHRLMTDGEVRNILGRFLFRGDRVFTYVRDLSGGEKARLSLLKLMLSGANTLILDEPTNHLDIASKEAFEEALMEYPGTVITVTHDRYFLSRIPDRIFELTEGGLREYLGKYDYYLEKKNQIESGKAYVKSFGKEEDREEGSSQNVSARESREQKKKADMESRRRERENRLLMEEIEKLEASISKIEEEMCLPENLSNHEKLAQLSLTMNEEKNRLEEAYARWMEIAEKG